MPDGEPRLENVLGQPVGLVRDTCDDDASGELEKVADSGPPQSEHDNPPYHVLTRKQKWPLVLLVAVAGIFSPMSANIFFSAITAVAESLHTSVQNVNLSVTAYMIAQGVTPSIWGAICDVKGRRPVLLATFCVYIAASAGLSATKTYPALVALRFLQAAGSASVNSIGGGFIGDIADRSERGGFMGIYQLGPQLGPTIGPVIGGLMTQAFGWQSIFAFLAAFSGVVFLIMAAVLPETLRSLVGNGSIPPKPVNTSLLYWLRQRSDGNTTSSKVEQIQEQRPTAKSWKDIDWLASVKNFGQPDVCLILGFNAICYTLFYSVITSVAVVLQAPYGLNESEIGLCFLAFGAGCIAAALLNTRRLDRDYRLTVEKFRKQHKDMQVARTDGDDFPIEHARLRTIPYYFVLLAGSVIGYGWAVQCRAHLAVPLILQFIVGITSTTITNSHSTLLVDLFPKASASAIASMNLSRCLLGAGGTAIVDPLLQALGPGWMYTTMALIAVVCAPLWYIEVTFGPRFRARRRRRAMPIAEQAL